MRLFDDVEVLDTPGVLRDPASLNRRKPYWMLLNLLPYDSTLREETIELLRAKLDDHGWRKLLAYYKIPEEYATSADWLELLETVARKRGTGLKSEDEADRAARRLIRDYQRGRFGRHTLEQPEEATISSPDSQRVSRAAEMAPMPLAKARPATPPSSAATRFSSTSVVGFMMRV